MAAITSSRPRYGGLGAYARANLLPVALWTSLLYLQVARFDFPPALPNVLIAVLMATCVFLFMFRADPTKTGTASDMVIAVLGTFVTFLMPEATQTTVVSTAIQLTGLVMWIVSLIALGRSLGIAPADRGLKDRGPYAFVRHPIYLSELVFWLGFALSAPQVLTFEILAIWAVAQVMRITREESIIEGYEAYKARVRWRVIPGVW
jgi:protein-S-isoprenylcysteine O-methyltransferase Ste14